MSANRSLEKNAVLNTVKTILSVIFPIITYPYVSRVLGLETMGRYNYAASIVSYFALIAALGINAYAIREGSRLREDRKAISQFGSAIFSINVYSTGIAYLLLVICTTSIKKLQAYRLLILALSIEVALTTFSVNWIYIIFEDYTFTTIISVILQSAAFLGMFIFVHSPEDVYKYALLTVISNYGYGVFTLLYSKKYVDFRFVPNPGRRHLKPILVIFLTSIATTIYINSDITILGWIKGDHYTGIYGTASKIYTIIKIVLNAVIAVTIPRMSYHIGRGDMQGAKALGRNVIEMLLALCLPAITGLYCLAQSIVEIYAGQMYGEASHSLRILSLALVFAVFAYFYANCILISLGREKVFMIATIISAALNIILNFILIPVWAERAAAFTTLLAEICVFLITSICAKRELEIKSSARNLCVTIIGCACIAIVCWVMCILVRGKIANLVLSIVISAGIYVLMQAGFGDGPIREKILAVLRRVCKK